MEIENGEWMDYRHTDGMNTVSGRINVKRIIPEQFDEDLKQELDATDKFTTLPSNREPQSFLEQQDQSQLSIDRT